MKTILIAENEAAIRRLVAEVLRKAGYRVLTAADGEEAISVARRNHGRVDLLVTDIVMSGMGGADLYAWMKTELPDLPVLFISGFMSREPLQGAFLKKPFTPAALVSKIQELLPQQRSAA